MLVCTGIHSTHWVCVHVHTVCVCVLLWLCGCVAVHVCLCVRVSVQVCVCVSMCLCRCVSVCLCLWSVYAVPECLQPQLHVPVFQACAWLWVCQAPAHRCVCPCVTAAVHTGTSAETFCL